MGCKSSLQRQKARVMPSHLSVQLLAYHRFRCWHPRDHVWKKCKGIIQFLVCLLKVLTEFPGYLGLKSLGVTPVISCLLWGWDFLKRRWPYLQVTECQKPHKAVEVRVVFYGHGAQKTCLVMNKYLKCTLQFHVLHYQFTLSANKHMQSDFSVLGIMLGTRATHVRLTADGRS